MGSQLSELEEECKKTGIFGSKPPRVSYPLGLPVLDQQLGCKYTYIFPDGRVHTDTQIGVPSGTFTMFLGGSQSGKSTGAVQAAWNVVEPFDEYAYIIYDDGENGMSDERVQGLTGVPTEILDKKFKLEGQAQVRTYNDILNQLIVISHKKDSDKKNYMYNTGHLDKYGNEIILFKPTVVIMDSLMKFTSDGEEIDEISDGYSAGREAIARNKFLRNALVYMEKYNINVFIIHHWSTDMRNSPGTPKYKQLPNLPSGVFITGGDRLILYMSSIIMFIPVNDSKGVKTEEENGYNGRPVNMLTCKTRTSAGGTIAKSEFVQEAGFDPRLTLLNFAKDKGLIIGKNPSCKFASNPDVVFDTRKFIMEMVARPELIKQLYAECRPHLSELIPKMDMTSDDPIRGSGGKISGRTMLRDIYSDL